MPHIQPVNPGPARKATRDLVRKLPKRLGTTARSPAAPHVGAAWAA